MIFPSRIKRKAWIWPSDPLVPTVRSFRDGAGEPEHGQVGHDLGFGIVLGNCFALLLIKLMLGINRSLQVLG